MMIRKHSRHCDCVGACLSSIVAVLVEGEGRRVVEVDGRPSKWVNGYDWRWIHVVPEPEVIDICALSDCELGVDLALQRVVHYIDLIRE